MMVHSSFTPIAKAMQAETSETAEDAENAEEERDCKRAMLRNVLRIEHTTSALLIFESLHALLLSTRDGRV